MVGILMGLDSRRRSVRLNDRQWAGLLLFVGIGQFAVIGLTISEAVYSEASPTGYSISQNYISDLGVGPAALIFDPSIILVGAGAIAVGVFTEAFGVVHEIVSLWTFIFIGLSAIFAARIVRPPFRYLSLVLGVLSLVALGLFIANADLGLGPGGMERMIVWPILVWGTAFGGYLFGSSSPAPAAAASP